MNVLRSLLFVPGSRPERFAKALAAGADLICIDLEDAVLPADKASARQAVVDFVATNQHVCVRVNPAETDEGKADLEALAEVNPDYVMLAKCSSVNDIGIAESALSDGVKLIGLIETPQGLDNATRIAASSNVHAIMFGGGDMSAELRCDFAYEPLLFARSQMVMAAARANVDLIDVPFINIKDEDGLIEETQKVRALGYTAKAAIHPCQINAIHRAFTPTDDQVQRAQEVINAVNGQEDAGVVVVNGRMIDRPIILASQRILKLAQAATS